MGARLARAALAMILVAVLGWPVVATVLAARRGSEGGRAPG